MFSRANRNRTSPSEQTVFSDCALTLHYALSNVWRIFSSFASFYTLGQIEILLSFVSFYTLGQIEIVLSFASFYTLSQIEILLSFASFYTLGQISKS